MSLRSSELSKVHNVELLITLPNHGEESNIHGHDAQDLVGGVQAS